MSDISNASIILPNQLFQTSILYTISNNIYIIEDLLFFSKYPFHKQKLILHRASMKFYYDYLLSLDGSKHKKIRYIENRDVDYDKLFSKHKIIHLYDPIDHSQDKMYKKLKKIYNTQIVFYDNPLFMETNEQLQEYYDSLKSHTNYYHDNGFYRWQRRRLNILMQDNSEDPLYDKWSFDSENRKPFDKLYVEPLKPSPNSNPYILEARSYINKYWTDNFGDDELLIYPVTFDESKKLFKNFIKNKLITFGKYEDAVSSEIPFGSHSILSSSINIGLITVEYIVKKICRIFDKLDKKHKKIYINSVEAFLRQIIGWRSYVRFIYKYHGKDMIKSNQFEHHNKVTDEWYSGNTQIYPIDDIINKVKTYAYAHHIERLMYIGNFALLCKIDPKEIYDWFMICFIDSYEWVMVPNVMGMSQYSSSEIKMMTRPYFSSSNYIKNMSSYKLNSYPKIGDCYWNEIWDALYYQFINDNIKMLGKIYAVARNVKHWKNKTVKQKKDLLDIAENYLFTY